MSKTEVSGKQLKDGSVELVDLSPALAGDINTLKSDVSTLQTDVAAKADAGNLATVATSGSYADLSNKPTIPSLTQVESDISSLDVRVTSVEADVATLQNSSVTNLSELGDVGLTTPVTGEFLKYEVDGWTNASLSTVATSGSYTDLTNKPSLFSGDYVDLANKPTIPSVAGLASETYVDTAVAAVVNSAPAVLNTLNELSAALGNDENFATTVAGQIGVVAADVSGLDTRVTSLESDIGTLQSAGAPNLSDLGGVVITTPSSGQVLKYDGLGWVNAADSTFSGAYADLTGKPTLFDGAYASLTGTPSLFSGSYVDLTNKPTLFDGAYSSLTGKPTLATVATSGSYNDLIDKPAAGASNLDGLSDVVITSAAKGHFIAHNGTNFVNTRTIEADVAATVPVTLKGAASQSGHLLELQNSAGTWLTRLTSTGLLRFNYVAGTAPIMVSNQWDEVMYMVSIGANSATSNSIIRLGTQVYQYTEFGFEGGTGSNGCFKIWGRADRCFAIQSPDNGSGVYTFDIARNTGTGAWELDSKNRSFNMKTATTGGVGINTAPGASFHTLSTLASRKGIIVQGAASQTANLFEAQDSAGTALASISAGGAATFNGVRSKGGGIFDTSSFSAPYAVTGTGSLDGNNYTHSFYGSTNQGTLLVGSTGIYPALVCANGVNEIFRTSQYGTSITPRSFESWAVALTVNNNHANPTTIANFQSNSVTKVSIGKSGDITASGTVHALRYTETVANAFDSSLAPATGTLTVNTASGNAVLGALSAAVTTWAFTNVPTDNSKVTTVTAVLAGNASYTYGDACSVNGSAVTNGIMWSGGSAPTATAGTDIITFVIVKDSAGTVKVFGSATTNFS